MAHIVLVGAGNMGFAMLKGWKATTSHVFTVVEPSERLRERAAAEGVDVLISLEDWEGAPFADAVIIATKPDTAISVVKHAGRISRNHAVVISVAAGVTIESIASRLGTCNASVIRSMPNMPAAIGEGMIVSCCDPAVTEAQRELAQELMSCVGKSIFVPDETMMDAVTAVSGSGPAYLFHFFEAFTSAAEAAGLPFDIASALVNQTVLGAAKLIDHSGSEPSELRRQVTSPNGTTEAALTVLMRQDSGLAAIVTEAVQAAKARSIELRATQ